MRVALSSPTLSMAPGSTGEIDIEVFNDRMVIDGVSTRVMGLDAQWVKARPARLALFPETAGATTLRITLPAEFPAGTHTVAVEVSSGVDAADIEVVPLELEVHPSTEATIVLEPTRVVGRRGGEFGATIENTGNTVIEVALVASDQERALAFDFDPVVVDVPPGRTVTAAVAVRSRTKLFGTALDRPFTVTGSTREAAYTASGTYVHQPVVPRGVLTAGMLMAIVAVWALVFLVALGQILNEDEANKAAPASFFATSEEVLEATGGASGDEQAAGASKVDVQAVGGSMTGVVRAASTDEPIGRITVDAVRITRDGPVTVASAATDDKGFFEVGGLPPGTYAVRYAAPGFREAWYPDAPTRTAGDEIQVGALAELDGLDAEIIGLPGSLAGVVETGTPPGTVPVNLVVRPLVGGVPGDPIANVGANAENAFAAVSLPTPGQYEITATAPGYQPTTVVERLGGGEARLTPTVRLSAGDGSISGVVTADGDPLGGVTVTVGSGEVDLTTATPTSGAVGRFNLDALPTPSTYLLTFTREGFGSETVAVELGPGEIRADLGVELTRGTGSVSGRVVDPEGRPLGDVAVSVAGGGTVIETSTLTAGGVGTFAVGGLATPGRYTLTFRLDGYAVQTIAVDLAASGFAEGVQVSLVRSAATIQGTVTCQGGSGLGGVQVTVTAGVAPIVSSTASDPPGRYVVAGLPPGSYAVSFSALGYASQTLLVELGPGAVEERDVALVPASGVCPP